MKKTNTYLTKTIYALIFIVALLLLFQVVAWIVGDGLIFDDISSVFADMLKLFYVETFYSAYFATLSRALIGFVLSLILGATLAVLANKFAMVKNLCYPLVSVVRLLPTMAIVSLLCVTFSPSFASVAVCFTVVMPYVYSSVLAQLELVSGELIEMAKVYSIPFGRILSGIYFPTLKYPFLALISTTFSFALKITVSSEVVSGALKSLGGLISIAQNVYLSPSLVVAITLWTVITGLVVELITALLIDLAKARSVK